MAHVVHVFCGPFPTVQGTQTLLRQTCELGYQSGFQTTLLCYAHACGTAQVPFAVERIPDFPPFHSVRSGLAWQKPLLDLSIARTLRKIIRKTAPDILHAHHYEALAACHLADPTRRIPLVFHQHARFGPELHTYASAEWKRPLQAAGLVTDGLLPATADHTIAVSHANARHLERTLGPDRVTTMLPPATDIPSTRHTPRAGTPSPMVIAYMGNLDPYQGLNHLVDAFASLPASLRSNFVLRLITDSDPKPLQLEAGVVNEILEIVPHGRFDDAWERLIESDVAVIPRSQDGGVPIKLVNCLAAGLPTIVDRNLAQGVKDGDEAQLVDASQVDSLAGALRGLTDPNVRARLSRGAPGAASRLFSAHTYREQLDRLYRSLLLS